MARLFLAALLLAAVFALSLVIAARYLPFYAVVGIALAELALSLFGLRWFLRRALRQFGINLFETKSSVLRGARFDLHSAAWVDPPPPGSFEEDHAIDDDYETTRWLEVDCTIEPLDPQSSAMSHWDPFDFAVVGYGTELSLEATDDAAPEGFIESVEGIEPKVASEEVDKIEGKARLRFVFGCPPGLPQDVVLRYYFESVGRFALPDPIQTATGRLLATNRQRADRPSGN